MNKILIAIAVLTISLAGQSQMFMHASIKKNAAPTKVDIVFKPTYDNTAGEYLFYLQFAVSIPAAFPGAGTMTASALSVNNFTGVAPFVTVPAYTEDFLTPSTADDERVFGWFFGANSPPLTWANGVSFTGVEVTFSSSIAATEVKILDLGNNSNGGGNLNTYYSIFSSPNGDLTDYPSMFFAIPGSSVLGTYPSGDQWAQTSSLINDNAPGAILLTVGAGCTGSPYTNVDATQSTGEPFAACKGTAGYKTVWYKFIAPASGNVRISTDFSGGTMGSDSRLALFSTDDVNNYAAFTGLACDDDNGSVVPGKSVLFETGLTPIPQCSGKRIFLTFISSCKN